jgi:hypothetical protein
MPAMAIALQIAIQWTRGAGKLSKDWERAELSKNLCASPFNKDLSNDTIFCQIQLAGEYL